MVNSKGAPRSMRTHRYLALTALLAVVVGACSSSSSPAPSAATSAARATPTPAASTSGSTAPSASAAAASPTPLAPDPAEAVIPNVEQNAQITFWTFYLSPTFDQYIKDTIARFQATYPTVTVKWEDHQATFKDDLNNAFAANIAPDVINLSVSEGWVSEYASKGLLLGLNSVVPKTVQDIYFPGLWNEQLVNGENFQFPWYQGLSVELINKAIYDKTGLTVDQFPKKVSDLPALCKTILDKTSTVCDIRLTVSDLLAQMVYEGGVKVYNSDNTAFAFNSPEGVAWLQMYVDMVKAGTVDNTVLTTNDDRVGLNAFSAGAAAFYQTGPNLARAVKDTNATLYSNLGMVQAPIGAVQRDGQGPDVDLRQQEHQVPERVHGARAVLHQPAEHGRVRQAGRGLSVVGRGLQGPVLHGAADHHRGQRPPAGREHRLDLRGHRPDRHQEGRGQRHRPQGGRVRPVQQRPGPEGARRGRDSEQQAHQVARTRTPRGSHPSAGPPVLQGGPAHLLAGGAQRPRSTGGAS